MYHLKKGLKSIILIALMILSAAFPVFAEGEGADPSLIAEKVTYLEDEPKSDVEGIWYSYLDTKNQAYGWEFPYSDSFFRTGSARFSLKMAQGSLGLALSAFRSSTGLLDPQYETYLKGAGFEDLFSFGYDEPSTEDSLSGVIGMKKIDDFTVVAAVTCGQGYGNEWAGNLKVGDSVRHEGFDQAAKLLEEHLDQYIKDKEIEGNIKLWLTGMSRAAAVANVTAADLTERGGFDDIYAYLFGVPRTTKEPVAYKGIYNICGQYDPVAATPFQSWGYERYGIDLYTPAQESNAEYPKYRMAAVDAGDKMGEDGFRNNPEVNYQLRLFLETLDELFDSSAEYSERMQPLILEAMKEKSENGDVTTVLTQALTELMPKNSREKKERSTMIDYISFVAAQHMRATQRQIEYGDWNPDEPLEANLVIEHRPVTYVKWLFSTDNAQDLFSNGTDSRRVTVTGDVDVAVYREGMGIVAINSKGSLSIPKDGLEAPIEEIGGVFAMRNGQESVISLPADADYDLVITADKAGPVTIYDVLVSAVRLRSKPGMIYTGDVGVGKCGLKVKAGQSPDDPVVLEGDAESTEFLATRFNYSPTVVMSNELDATKNSYLSLSVALRAVGAITAAAIAFLVICLLLHLILKYKERKGHAPYSDWFVIVPHLIVIAVSAILAQFVSYYLYSVGSARAMCAAITLFYIFLLAIRAAFRKRKPLYFLISALMLLAVYLTGLHYNRLPIDSFSIPNMIAFFVVTALFSAVAVKMYLGKPAAEAHL